MPIKITDAQERGMRFAYFVLGAAIPMLGWALFRGLLGKQQGERLDRAHDVTVEDSFPASDPPSAW